MRENMGLYRAMRKDNGEWVEGYYAVIIDDYNGEEECAIFPLQNTRKNGDGAIDNYCFVVPETAGEFTGVTDQNGKKIFEWDIVKRGDRIWIIEYDVKCAQFVMKTYTESGVFWIRSFDLIPSEWCEVIGNKFDNPELIKGGENNGKTDIKGRTRQKCNNYK